MAEKPKIIRRVPQSEKTTGKDFSFTENQIRYIDHADAINTYRKHAYEIYKDLTLPTNREEPWRRTDLKGLLPGRFHTPDHVAETAYSTFHPNGPDPLDQFYGKVHLSPFQALVNHHPSLKDKGVIFTDLITAEKNHLNELSKALGKIIQPEEGKFAALSAAFNQNGIFLYVPKGVVLEQPLQSILMNEQANTAFITHIVIFLDEGASATYFQEYHSDWEDNQKFHSGLVEIFVGKNAHLKFVEIQDWDEGVWNFTHERIQVHESGSLDWVIGALGSHLTKSFIDLDLVGTGAEAKVSGFTFTGNNQHLDYDTQQNHLVGFTTSDLLFKCALNDSSRNIWQGMIYVAPGADKTDGYQSNRNLVLSPDARADSIPGLEILANDVRCTHGATVGDIDFEQVFYLMSRGILRKEAEKLLVEGFFDPIMQRIPFESVRNRFSFAILEKLNIEV